MRLDERQKAFIGHLLHLAKEGQEDRGALADLRSGLGKEPSRMSRVHKHVVPYLAEKSFDDTWYYLIATLFGLYPRQKPAYPRTVDRHGKKRVESLSLGAAFHPLRRKSDSMEARFVALLNAHPDDLRDHLRHVISLLKADEQPIDWFQLFEDMLQWDHPDGHVQLRWARDFYRSGAEQTDSPSSPSNDPSLEEEEQDHE